MAILRHIHPIESQLLNRNLLDIPDGENLPNFWDQTKNFCKNISIRVLENNYPSVAP